MRIVPPSTAKLYFRASYAILRDEGTAAAEKTMAGCELGYLCDVCGRDVEQIIDSDLYLRYVLGEVPPLALPRQSERHIRCNPALAQFIVDPAFAVVCCEGIFAKENLDGDFVRDREVQVTRAWRRLQEIPRLGIAITEYPLPEVLQRWAGQS